MGGPRGMTLLQRFEAKVIPVTESGCWLWMGASNHRGYGLISVDKKTFLSHRISWGLHRFPIPDGLHVCHHCDVPACVNPDHLFLGTNMDNMMDKVRKGRAISHTWPIAVAKSVEARRRRTHCKHGHLLSGENLYTRVDRPMDRGCKACRKRQVKEYLCRKRG